MAGVHGRAQELCRDYWMILSRDVRDAVRFVPPEVADRKATS